MGKDKRTKSKKQQLSKERRLEKKRRKKEDRKKKQRSKSHEGDDNGAVVEEEVVSTAADDQNGNTATFETGVIPIELTAGIRLSSASNAAKNSSSTGFSWGAAFAAANRIRPNEGELDDDFLARTASAEFHAAGKDNGILNISQLASSHVMSKNLSGRKRTMSESSAAGSNVSNDNNDSNASVDSSEIVLEGRTAVLPGNDNTRIAMILVDKQSGLVYSSGQRTREGKRLQIGKLADGGKKIVFDIKAIEEMKRIESGNETSSLGQSFPYDTNEDDHCETPAQAYVDIQSILDALCKSIGKSKSSLKIYDPYFCNGSVVRNLASLGYSNVYNKREDCYAVWEAQKEPHFDVFITNPPYSSDHIEKLMTHITSTKFGKTPWLLLMPNWVHKKDYYENFTLKNQINPSYPFYVVPKKRYVYVPPPNFRKKRASDVQKKNSPFVSMWYVWGGTSQTNDELMHAFQRSGVVNDCDLARSKSVLRDLRRNRSDGKEKGSKKKKNKSK